MLKDRFDNLIEVGCVVTFPTRVGSSLWMVDGIVTGIEMRPSRMYFTDDGGNKKVPFVMIKTFVGKGLFKDPSRNTFTEMIDRITVVNYEGPMS